MGATGQDSMGQTSRLYDNIVIGDNGLVKSTWHAAEYLTDPLPSFSNILNYTTPFLHQCLSVHGCVCGDRR